MRRIIMIIIAIIIFFMALAPAVENVRLREDLRIANSIVAVTLPEIKKVAPIPEQPKFIPRPAVRVRKKGGDE